MAHPKFNHSSSDLTNTSAWNTSTLPAAGDYVYLSDGSQDAVTFPTGGNIKDFAWLELGAGYSGQYATSGTPATIKADIMVCRGSKTAYVVGGATQHVDVLVVDSLNNALAVSVDGSVPNLVVKRGRVVVQSTLSPGVINIYVVGAQADVLVESGISTPTINIFVTAGNIECQSASNSIMMTGGECSQKEAIATTLHLFGGKLFYWYRDDTQSSDDILGDVVVANGGELDLTVDPRTCNTATDAFLLPGGLIRTMEGQFTATGRIVRAGGRLEIL